MQRKIYEDVSSVNVCNSSVSFYFYCTYKGIEPLVADSSPSTPAESLSPTSLEDDAEIKEHLLLRPGPLTTPRAVYKSIRYSMRPKARERPPDILKNLSDEGLGSFLQMSTTESVYFKPEPVSANEERVKPHLKKSTWQEYCEAFSKRESNNLISVSQFERLLAKSPISNQE